MRSFFDKEERRKIYIYIYMVGTQVTKRLVAQWAFLNIPNRDMYIDLNSFTPIIDIKEGKKISRLSDRYFAMVNSWSIFFAWIVT